MLTLTSPIETPFHRLPAGLKLLALCAATVVLFAMTTPVLLTTALGLIIAAYATGGAAFARHGAAMIRPVWPFVVVIAVWHLITDDVRGGVAIILRMVAAVAAANLVTMTTRLDDMIGVIERLSRPLAGVGLPPRRLALAIALVIRFIPVLSDRMGEISDAWRARAPHKPGWRILMPATLAALDDAEHVAEALRARGGAG